MNRNARETLLVFGEQTSEERRGGRPDVAEAKFAFFARGRAANAADRIIELFEEKFGFAQENSAGGRETDVMPAAFEDGGAEESFELFDRAAEGRLGDAQTARRGREAQFFGHRLEILEVTEFHAVLLYVPRGARSPLKALGSGESGAKRRTPRPGGGLGIYGEGRTLECGVNLRFHFRATSLMAATRIGCDWTRWVTK